MYRLLMVYFHACIRHCGVTPSGKCLPRCVFREMPSRLRLPGCVFREMPSRLRLPGNTFQVASSGKHLPGSASCVATAMERVRKCRIVEDSPSWVLLRECIVEDSPPQKEANGKRHENNRNQAKIVSSKPIFLRNSRGLAAGINRDASPINPRKHNYGRIVEPGKP